jgi:negative regulator of sigma E activity
MRWANPHAWIYIDVESDDGTVTNWALETRAANNLIRLGWRREDLPAGTELVVEAWQARNGTPTASIESVTFSDGRSLFVGSPDQPQP